MKLIDVKMLLSAVLLGGFGSIQVAQAAPLAVDVGVNNYLPEGVQLTSANWPLGDRTPADYAISTNVGRDFTVGSGSEKRGVIRFSYSSSGGKSCLFTAGHDLRESFGWFTATQTPYQWADGKSQGNFLATCTGKVVSNTPGKGYKVMFDIK